MELHFVQHNKHEGFLLPHTHTKTNTSPLNHPSSKTMLYFSQSEFRAVCEYIIATHKAQIAWFAWATALWYVIRVAHCLVLPQCPRENGLKNKKTLQRRKETRMFLCAYAYNKTKFNTKNFSLMHREDPE